MSILNTDDFGEILTTKREDASPKLSQPALSRKLRAAGVPSSSQANLSRLEQESTAAAFMVSFAQAAHRDTVLREYGFSQAERRKLNERFNLDIGHLLDSNVPHHGPPIEQVDLIHFPIYESASAGTGDGGPLDEDPIPLPKTFLASKAADPANVMLVKINGDCMVSHESRFGAKSIAHGDYAIVEIGRPPVQGDRQMFWDARDHQLIIKYVGEGANSDSVTLYDERGATYHRPAEDPELIYRGVVLGRFGMY